MPKTDRPSRELDVKVAKALGWFGPVMWVEDDEGRDPYMYEPDILHRDWVADRNPETRGERNSIVPRFSSRIQDGWPLVAAINARGKKVNLAQGKATEPEPWVLQLVDDHGEYEIVQEIDGATPELALCAAFLHVVKLQAEAA